MAQRIYRRRVQPSQVVSIEFATFLCQVSADTGRQVGVLLDRKGHPDHVILGDANKLWLPDIGRLRAGKGRLRGLRLIHTHLRGESLSNDDLTDLALLRLDLVAAIAMNSRGQPALVHAAHLLPENPEGQLWSLLKPVSIRELDLDFLELVRSLEEEFARASRVQQADLGVGRGMLVHVRTQETRRPEETCVAELKALCRTADVQVLDVVVQRRDRIDPRYAVGRGKLEEMVLRANQIGAELLIFDPDLNPAQARAISDFTELKVIDRTMLILDIFAQRARSRDGKIQVELAQLSYTLPRLVAKNTMMSRLTGGIGGRGPGETKLEVNRRRARERINRLEQQIRQLSRRRGQRRSLRQRRGLPVVAIVGYTNAGKSTLLNTLTQSTELVEDKLFATLDPKSRRLRFPRDREVILTDTVGFIHDLPKELVNAFRATLEEVADADLLIHLVDISDADYEDQIRSVRTIIGELRMNDKPQLMVFNKQDRLRPEQLTRRLRDHEAIPICARDAQTTRPLLETMEGYLWRLG
jgi:GTP-binding protein HflX